MAEFVYRNDQPSTTIWYHDHSLGMTRNNVYAGPAGFWLLREPDGGETGLVSGTLPGPAPVAGEDLATTNLPASLGGSREKYREIPIVIQDRSFNADGSLFYPGDRAFFEGLAPAKLQIPFIGDKKYPSDIAPIWNPEAFFNVMVVNGVSWPTLQVEPDIYRFRLLDGCNSRFLNLSLQALDAPVRCWAKCRSTRSAPNRVCCPTWSRLRPGSRRSCPAMARSRLRRLPQSATRRC